MWTPNRRTRTKEIKVIVLHSTGGGFASAVSWLMNKLSRVSAHFVIARDGTVKKLAPLSSVTWHAGRALWNGEKDVNGISIGIEMAHIDGKQNWPEPQVQAVLRLISDIRGQEGQIAVTSHAFVAIPRGRKVDPVGFPWERIPPPAIH